MLIAKLDSATLAELTSVARRQFPWLSGGERDTPHLAIHVRAFGQDATPGPTSSIAVGSALLPHLRFYSTFYKVSLTRNHGAMPISSSL